MSGLEKWLEEAGQMWDWATGVLPHDEAETFRRNRAQMVEALANLLQRRIEYPNSVPDPSGGKPGWFYCTGCGWLFYRTVTDSWCVVIDVTQHQGKPTGWVYGAAKTETWDDLCESYADCVGHFVRLLPPREYRSTEEA